MLPDDDNDGGLVLLVVLCAILAGVILTGCAVVRPSCGLGSSAVYYANTHTIAVCSGEIR